METSFRMLKILSVFNPHTHVSFFETDHFTAIVVTFDIITTPSPHIFTPLFYNYHHPATFVYIETSAIFCTKSWPTGRYTNALNTENLINFIILGDSPDTVKKDTQNKSNGQMCNFIVGDTPHIFY